MIQRLPTIVILITAATWAGFGIWLGTNPTALLTAFGVDAHTPQMRTEIRAFYGGVELAISVAMIVLWVRSQLFASLLIGGLPLGFSAVGRCVGMAADGFSTLHTGFAILEFSGALLCFLAARTIASNAERK